MASTLLQTISQDDYEKARFLSKRKFENDYESDKNTAIKIREFQIAKEMLQSGLTVYMISKCTGLSEKEIEKLKGMISRGEL